jgi:Zn-dependent protease/CBS domain-containing protein
MDGSIRLGTIRGIPLFISPTWLIIFVLFLWTFAGSYYPDRYEGWTSQAYFAAGLTTAVLFFASVVIHEFGHALTAERFGIRTRRITLLPIGGLAEIEREAEKPGHEFAIAIAGPLTSLLLGGLFLCLYFLLHPINVPLGGITAYLGWANIVLALFNLIPGFPMDGGRVLRAIVWGITKSYGRATRVAAGVGSFVAYAFIFFGVTLLFRGQLANGIILAFMGWFILSSAQMSVQQLDVQQGLAGVAVAQVMSRAFATVDGTTNLARAMRDVFLGYNTRTAAVMHGERFVGFVTLTDVMRVPQERWEWTTVADVMVPTQRLVTVQPDAPVLTAVHLMQEGEYNQLPVLVEGRMVGLITRNDILRFLQLRRSVPGPAMTGDDRRPPRMPDQVPQ